MSVRQQRPGGRVGGDLLTPAQAASILGVSTASVRLWAAEGRLPFTTTPGGHRRFSRADVLDLVAEVRGVAVTAPEERSVDLGTRERTWVRTIAAAMRAAAADLGTDSDVAGRFSLEAERWEILLERARRDQ